MKNYKIQSLNSGDILFEGTFASFLECLEQAAQEQINLSYADLRHQNLMNVSLDDALLKHADFSGSNLTGANLSEANLHSACFQHSALYNTCMAYADLQACDFIDASFGATDITGSNLSFCRFSTLSCFTLDFAKTSAMKDCTFTNPDGQICPMSKPPIVVKGLGQLSIAVMDEHIKIDHEVVNTTHWLKHIAAPLTNLKNQTLN